uniref:Uncharacterized protein n=1 Tax=Triticum urartu TaxID=4572 RepID=A0A8R7Q064_TRIUA
MPSLLSYPWLGDHSYSFTLSLHCEETHRRRATHFAELPERAARCCRRLLPLTLQPTLYKLWRPLSRPQDRDAISAFIADLRSMPVEYIVYVYICV